MRRFSWFPRLPRRVRIVRNFLAALLLLAAVVLALGVPPLTKYGVFRRLEEEYLLPPSQLVYRVDHGSWGVAYLTQRDGWMLAGNVTTGDSGGTPLFHYEGYITHILPLDQMQVVILPLDAQDGSAVVALWGAPEGAVTGELELTLEDVEVWYTPFDWTVPERENFSAQGVRREDGWFFFSLAPHTDHPNGEWCAMEALWNSFIFWRGAGSWPYRLTLRDAGGNVVLETAGTTAQANVNLSD